MCSRICQATRSASSLPNATLATRICRCGEDPKPPLVAVSSWKKGMPTPRMTWHPHLRDGNVGRVPARPDDATPNPLSRRDAAALIGVLAILEGHALADDLDEVLSARLAQRLEREGLLQADSGSGALQRALNGLNHRLRYALGEY